MPIPSQHLKQQKFLTILPLSNILQSIFPLMSPSYYPYLRFLIPKIGQQKELWWVDLGWTPAAHKTLSSTALFSRKRGDEIRAWIFVGQDKSNLLKQWGQFPACKWKKRKTQSKKLPNILFPTNHQQATSGHFHLALFPWNQGYSMSSDCSGRHAS